MLSSLAAACLLSQSGGLMTAVFNVVMQEPAIRKRLLNAEMELLMGRA